MKRQEESVAVSVDGTTIGYLWTVRIDALAPESFKRPVPVPIFADVIDGDVRIEAWAWLAPTTPDMGVVCPQPTAYDDGGQGRTAHSRHPADVAGTGRAQPHAGAADRRRERRRRPLSRAGRADQAGEARGPQRGRTATLLSGHRGRGAGPDRKSVVEGKSGAGGGRERVEGEE